MPRGDRSVDVFVRKLRTKLERLSPSWRYVHTHYGIGYRFAAEAHETPDVTRDLSNSIGFASPRGWTTTGTPTRERVSQVSGSSSSATP